MIKNNDAKKVTPRPRPLRVSNYEAILKAESKLKPGRTLTVPIPRGVSCRQLQMRLHSIEQSRIRQGLLTLLKGYKLSKYETVEGELAITLKEV